MFDAWTRLLKEVDGSVLWLIGRNEAARRNLRAEAAKRGVDPDRLVFAPYAKLDVHLARHARADLFLDTLPHNAHTTASDALWAGVPVLTIVGDTFAGRVGESLLNAVGMPELVTRSMDDYVETALEFARAPEVARLFRGRLAESRTTGPLFDGARYARNLERAFERMVAISRAGEAPRGFDVAAE
jgi:predicted O-linked N-acetylglucosamine transferase (SPINDLY family)